MSLKLAVATFVAAGLVIPTARAAEDVSGRRVLSLGCHHVNGVCYVTLDGPAFGASLGCSLGALTEFRFDDGDTAIGRRSYASFLAAYLADKSVEVMVNGCTSQGFPALAYFRVSR